MTETRDTSDSSTASSSPRSASSSQADASKLSSTAKPSKPKKDPKDAIGPQFRRLLALAVPEKRTLYIASIFLFIGTAMGLLYPKLIGEIMEKAIKPGASFGTLDQIALLMVAIFLIQGAAVGVRSYLFTVAGERIVTRLRHHLFRHLVQQETAFFDQNRTGELLNRLSSDTTILQNTVSVNISMALRNFLGIVGTIGLLFYTSPVLTLLMLAIVPPVAIGAVAFSRIIRKLSKQTQDALAKASEVAEEALSGIRTVRAYAHEIQESERYAKKVEVSFEIAKKRSLYTSLFSAGASFAGYSAIAVVLWYGGRLVITKQMSIGDLTSFVLYTLTLAFSLAALASLWTDFMRASGATERVFELMDRKPAIHLTDGQTPSQTRGGVAFQGVDFSYPSRPDIQVLQKLSLEIQPGERIALVGPSGGGKSTIASLMTRMYDPDKGSIRLDGTDFRDLSASWLRQQIAVVEQEPTLFSTSIEDNIRYGREGATLEEIQKAALVANADKFIQTFPEKYATEVGERGVQLSGGQKQRVAIARAVLKDPKILILDEATSALDAESEALVKEALDRLMKDRTTLIIAHRLSTVKDAHRVLVIDKGQIVQSGTHDELAAQEGIYKRLIQKQFVTSS